MQSVLCSWEAAYIGMSMTGVVVDLEPQVLTPRGILDDG